MSFIAVNVCLVCNVFDTATIPLSCSMCPAPAEGDAWDEKTSYRLVSLAEKKLQKGLGHAHCTVAQLCVRAADIGDVKDAVKTVWTAHREKAVRRKERLLLSKVRVGPVFGQTSEGEDIHLPSVGIRRSEALLALHKEIVEVLAPFQVQLGSMEVAKTTFHKNFPVESPVPAQWMIDFMEKYALDNYDPHITLGASPVDKIDNMTFFQDTKVPWRECRLVISHMGNYCSCFELLE